MKREFSRKRNCWQAAVLAASILGACGPVQENPSGDEAIATEEKPLTGVTLGIATGTFYVSGEQPLSDYSEQAFCEFSNLGVKWIRIEADSPGVDADTYRRIVQKAHAKNIKVLAVVPARYCGADNQTEIDAFAADYVSHLNDLATTVFTGTGAVDAYEIGNKPNVTEALCPDGVSRFRVAPNAFAWLLRRTWDNWKVANGRAELIVSGGVVNTYTTEPFWNTLAGSQAFKNGTAKVRPFDYFGIQPYNNANMDVNCINSGLTTCFTAWKNNVTSGLKAAATRLNTTTGTSDTKLFATEFGFQVVSGPSCTGVENCTLLLSAKTGNPPVDPPPYLQLAAAMAAAGDALVNSAVTPFAIWYDYRDDDTKGFGLRASWDPTPITGNKYPAKAAGWNKYRSMAGGTGSTNAEACWAKGNYFPVDFENGDTLRSTSAGDWAYGYYKGECAPGERIMGLSRSYDHGDATPPTADWARLGLCYKDPLDAGRYTHPTPTLPACSIRNVLAGDDRGSVHTTSEDWDSGNYRAECAPTEYVAGVAQSQDHLFSHILCCPATVSATSCTTVAFGSGDNRQTTDSGNWDAAGYKGECGVGRYVAGVSRTPAGLPSALLCCNQ